MPTLLCLLALPCAALAKPTKQPEALTALASQQLGKDFRIQFTLKKNENVCGAVGDAYVGQVQVNRYQRGYSNEGQSQVTERWVAIDKHYAILASDVLNADAALFDTDTCME